MQRLEIRHLLENNASEATVEATQKAQNWAYKLARFRAATKTGLELSSFPETMPFTDSDIWGSNQGDVNDE